MSVDVTDLVLAKASVLEISKDRSIVNLSRCAERGSFSHWRVSIWDGHYPAGFDHRTEDTILFDNFRLS
jgi:hypothetical protein